MKKIVRGNDFTLRIPVMKIVNGEKVAFPLPGCTDIKVNVVNQYRRIALSYTIDVSEDNVLLARVEGDRVAVGTYALEVKGKLFGNDWRSNEYEQFQLVDNNASGDTVFEPHEGEDSVEMDTALVVLAPAVELGNLIKDAEETIADTKEALKGVETKMGDIEQRADTAIGAATTAAERANTAAKTAEQTNTTVETAEQERETAEQERKTAEEQRKSQMQSNAEAERARAVAEQHRVEAEKRRASEETMRAEAEDIRKTKEADRIAGETSREKQENSRVAAEQTRESQEKQRKLAEVQRDDAETKRADAENTRKRMEADRANAEAERAAAEKARAYAETKRAAAETKRETDFSVKVAEVDTAVKNAKTATSEAEKVDATITAANVLEVTGRDGVKKSLELASQADAATIKMELAGKFDKMNVVQELGEAEDKVMSQKAVSDKFNDLETKAVPFNEQVGAVQVRTGNIVTGYSGYYYVDIDISNIRKLRIKGQNSNAGLGYAIFKEDGNYIASEGDTYISSTFSDIELTFSDEAKRLRFCYYKPTNAVQKINVIEYKNDLLIDKTNLLAKQSFTLGSISDTIKGKYINSSGTLVDSPNAEYSTKYFAVRRGDKVQVENYVRGNRGNSPISFVLGEEVLSFTNSNLINKDNSTSFFTAPQDCLCYIPRYNSSDSDNAIINIIHASLVDFTEDIQKGIQQDIDLIKDNSLSLDNRYQYKAAKKILNGILVGGNILTFADDTFYKAKNGEVLLFKDIYNTNVRIDLISIYSDATEESFIKPLYTINAASTQSKQPDVRVEIPQDCFFRISTASNSQTVCPLKVYRTVPLYDVVDAINVELNGFKDTYKEEKTIQVPLVAHTGNITKYYKCSDKCLIVCDDFIY